MANARVWKKRVADWRSSGLSAVEYARGRDFAAGTLKWWSSRLNRGHGAAPALEDEASARVVSFARVVRTTACDAPSTSAAAAQPTSVGVIIELGESVRLRLERGFDAAELVRAADALLGLAGRGVRS